MSKVITRAAKGGILISLGGVELTLCYQYTLWVGYKSRPQCRQTDAAQRLESLQ